MYVLNWDKHLNCMDQESRMTSHIVDTGRIEADTIDEVKAKAIAMVLLNYGTRELGELKDKIEHKAFPRRNYYSYEFGATIVEVKSEIAWNSDEIKSETAYRFRVESLTKELHEQEQKFLEKQRIRDKATYIELQKKLGITP